MIEGLTRDVTAEEIAEYRESGVVRLRGILPLQWLETLGDDIDRAFGQERDAMPVYYDSSAFADEMAGAGVAVLSDERATQLAHRGRFLSIIGAWTVSEGVRRLALESPLGYVAARLFGARKVNFYDDQVLTKEPGAREYTAFHTDEPYYHLHGDQVCGMWVSPDVVTADSGAMQYVRGSHRWPSFFKPNAFVTQSTLDSVGVAEVEEEQEPLPDIEGHRDQYDIIVHPSEPGDVIVHHSRLVHGSGPNYTMDSPRRAVSLRYAGDDVTYWFHKSAPPQPHHRHGLRNGDPIDCDQFPVVWRVG
ncbi:MAG: phytanoyl-CoA dioxygenase family protein [Gammaproteobacteria bacterium]